VLGSWMLLPLPAWFGRVTMLDRLEPARAVLPMALASVLALVLTVFHLRQSPDKLPTRVLLAAVVMFLVPYAWAAGQYAVEGSATNHGATAIMLLVVGLGVGLALAVPTKQYGLAVLLAFGLWQASQINPIQHGTTVLTDNELARSIGTLVGDADRAGSGWVVFAAGAYASGTVTASGVDNLSAVSPYPDVDAWTILDPSRAHEEIWNRYAHVAFELGEPGSEPDFSLPNADVIVITIDPCDQRLIDLGVDFLVTPEGTNPGCGHLVKTVELGDSTLLVFKR
jgi:hypothetical protein